MSHKSPSLGVLASGEDAAIFTGGTDPGGKSAGESDSTGDEGSLRLSVAEKQLFVRVNDGRRDAVRRKLGLHALATIVPHVASQFGIVEKRVEAICESISVLRRHEKTVFPVGHNLATSRHVGRHDGSPGGCRFD